MRLLIPILISVWLHFSILMSFLFQYTLRQQVPNSFIWISHEPKAIRSKHVFVHDFVFYFYNNLGITRRNVREVHVSWTPTFRFTLVSTCSKNGIHATILYFSWLWYFFSNLENIKDCYTYFHCVHLIHSEYPWKLNSVDICRVYCRQLRSPLLFSLLQN